MRHPKSDPVLPGQESVWDYPRPAILESTDRHLKIVHQNQVLADTKNAYRTLETSHPPTYYLPPQDVDMAFLKPNTQKSLCEWKGQARYYDYISGNIHLSSVAWTYPDPTPAFVAIKNHIAFYAHSFNLCTVDGETVIPQPGGFYGGWITSHVAGPFKGIPGSRFW